MKENAVKDWTTRFTCNEQNVKKYFTKWTLEKKTRQKQEQQTIAGAVAPGKKRGRPKLGTQTQTVSLCNSIDEEIVDTLGLRTDQSQVFENLIDLELQE